jgi:hypothetical protein
VQGGNLEGRNETGDKIETKIDHPSSKRNGTKWYVVSDKEKKSFATLKPCRCRTRPFEAERRSLGPEWNREEVRD